MASFSGNVTGGTLAFRASPPSGTNYGNLANNASVNVNTLASNDTYYSYRNEWFKTTYGGNTGYVMARWIAVTSGGSAGTITTSATSLNIRATPSASGTVSFTVAKNATVRVLEGPTSGFYRIGCASGTGWGSVDYITTSGGSGGWTGGDGSTGDTSTTYTNAKCIGNVQLYELDNPYDLFPWPNSKISGTVTVYDTVSDYRFMKYDADSKVFRSQIDVSHAKKPATTVFGTSTLQNGNSNAYIIHLQHYLNRYLAARGYATFTVDGAFGPTTQAKVESFQTYWHSLGHTMSVDGIVGSATKTALAYHVHTL